MSDELDMVISADITIARYSDAVYGDIFRKEEPERFQFSAVGDEEIRRIVQEAANNAFPDRRERLTITYHLDNDNTKRPEKQYVYHLFPTANVRGLKIPVEEKRFDKVYYSYDSFLENLDTMLRILKRKYQTIKRRNEQEQQRREECAGLLDYRAEEEDLPAFSACVCPDCEGTEFHWQKEDTKRRAALVFPDEKGRRHRFARLRPRWVLVCDGCGENIPEMAPTDFIKDAESGNLYAYDERSGRFSIYERDNTKEPWKCIRQLNAEEEEALPEHIKVLRKVGADYREAYETAKSNFLASSASRRAQATTEERS